MNKLVIVDGSLKDEDTLKDRTCPYTHNSKCCLETCAWFHVDTVDNLTGKYVFCDDHNIGKLKNV